MSISCPNCSSNKRLGGSRTEDPTAASNASHYFSSASFNKTSRDAPREVPKEPAKERAREPARDSLKDPSNCSPKNSLKSSIGSSVVRFGFYRRREDSTRQQRYRCKRCKRSFSAATDRLCFRQKKRKLNPQIYKLLVSGVSQRRAALILSTNRKTVVRKFIFLGLCCHQILQPQSLRFWPQLGREKSCTEVEFDDLETFEHSKLKPLSVILMVETQTRKILGFKVARMPAKGLLVERALKKYGPRVDERKNQRRQLFQELQGQVDPYAVIKSDESPHYPSDVKKYFPNCKHQTFKGRRGCVVGQGELKSGGFDPLFSLNHSFAMCRANINRLFRRTWNTTKKPERLDLHLALYALYHNFVLT